MTEPDDDLDAHSLRVVKAIADTGSITAAAHALGYSQPAVSQQLRRLERRAGTPIVERVGRGVRLTEAGRVLARHAAVVTTALEAAAGDLAELRGLRAGRVRIAAFPSASSTVVPRVIAAVTARRPGVSISFVEAEPPEAIVAVREDRADIALTYSYPGDRRELDLAANGLTVRTVGGDDTVLVLPVDHPAANGPIDLSRLAGERWIAGCPQCRGHLLEACARAGFVPDIAFETDNYIAVENLVAQGVGVAILPRMAVASFPLLSGIAAPRLPDAEARTLHVVTARGAERVPAVGVALEVIDEVLAEYPHPSGGGAPAGRIEGMSATPDPRTTTASGADVRVRFCPSPTGLPHVGLIRTVLFNWAYARHNGGKLVFRIEDTDAARDSEESYQQLLDALRWMNIDWDEGVEVGGPHAPYRQSQRHEIYREVLDKLVAAGAVYESYSTAEEIDARNEANGRAKQLGYDNFDRDLTEEQKAAFRAEGRQPAWRLRVPDHDLSYVDLIRGEVTFPAGSFPDFVLVRAGGVPLYPFVNPVDDALMGITHVIRGEDLMPSTARQLALCSALVDAGVTTFIPRFGHMPLVLGETGNKKLSKRDPQADLFLQREKGFIHEGLLNYLSLLGWSLASDRDVFSLDEMVAAFDIADVNPNPARFDQKKAEAINGDHIRMLDADDFAARIVPYLAGAGYIAEEPSPEHREIIAAAAPLVQQRVQLLGEVPGMLGFLFVSEVDYAEDALKGLPANAGEVLVASVGALELVPEAEFTAAAVQEALSKALVEELGLKPRVAYGPPRVALTGRRISPPLFESMELLGKVETLRRLDALVRHLG